MPRTYFSGIRLAAWAALVFHLLAQQAWAKSKHIDFEKMVAGCEAIAVARFAGELVVGEEYGVGSADLELTRIIKGSVEPGRRKVGFGDAPSVDPNTREFVAFFGEGMSWEFVAVPIVGNRLADGVLRVYGFYNKNAYSVNPGLVTLAQIEGFVRDRTLAYTFRGPLYFPQRGRAAWRASDLEIEVSYDALKNRAEVRGLPELQGFPDRPEVYVSGHRDEYEVHVTYSRNMDRPLEIVGRVQGAGEGGVMAAKFFVKAPDLPTRAAFEGYVADRREGHSYYTVRITCAPRGSQREPRVLTLTMGEERGRMSEIAGLTETPLRLDGFGGGGPRMTATAKLPDGRELGLQFDLPAQKAGPDVFRWTFQEWLLYDLLVADISGKVLLDGKEITTFVASLGEVRDAGLGGVRPVPERAGSSWEISPDGWALVGVGGVAVAAVVWAIRRRKRARRGTVERS